MRVMGNWGNRQDPYELATALVVGGIVLGWVVYIVWTWFWGALA